MAKKQQEYGNDSIRQLKGADRVRKRPAVIFGSDGVEGCAHSIFEIISNSIDEARDGHGNRINVTLFPDHVVEVEDFGRGIPVDYNKAEERWNWDLVFCELYAGGKYAEGSGNYDFSLGLNGLGLCATQYASEWMTADIYRDGFHYHLDFQKGENVGGLQKEPYKGRRTGSIIHWKPDDEVFTDIDVPGSYYKDVLRRQAVVNAGLTLNFTDEKEKDPATGKRRVIEAKGRTKAEARERFEAKVGELERTGLLPGGKSPYLVDYADRWLADYRTRVKPTTYRTRAGRIKACTDVIGHVRLKDITPEHIRHCMRTLGERLASSTLKDHYVSLKMVLDQAELEELIPIDPCRRVKPPCWRWHIIWMIRLKRC